MSRACRCFVPGHVWHITHRCHDRAFLFKAETDRDNWRQWLFEARRRYGICVLNYIVTRNHIHLLAYDVQGAGAIAKSMQLLEGQVAQVFNRRRRRSGAFWEGRYHAVAVESGEHLARCVTYIDLNMVRAGAVGHPLEWRHSGFVEVQSPRSRYQVIDLQRLAAFIGCSSLDQLQRVQRDRAEAALSGSGLVRDPVWTEALAVGSEDFATRFKAQLGIAARSRSAERIGDRFCVMEQIVPYNRKTPG